MFFKGSCGDQTIQTGIQNPRRGYLITDQVIAAINGVNFKRSMGLHIFKAPLQPA
jgi:hypothetical protein